MKKCKILCMLLAVVLVLPIFASCTSGKAVAKDVSLKFVIPATEEGGEDDVRFMKAGLTVEGSVDNPPTVLQAVEEALREYEVPYKLTADGASIGEVFGLAQKDSSDAEKGYFQYWECTINGKFSDDGRQSVTNVYDGDEIVFTWTVDSKGRQDTTVPESKDPNADTTGAIPSNTTAETTEE